MSGFRFQYRKEGEQMSKPQKKVLVGKYKGDLFLIPLKGFKGDGTVVLHTSDGQKAQRYGMKVINGKEGYEDLLVPADEVEMVCDREYYNRELFKLDLKFRECLSGIKFLEKPKKVSQELINAFKENNIELNNDALIKFANQRMREIIDGINRYRIYDDGKEIIVYNGGRL